MADFWEAVSNVKNDGKNPSGFGIFSRGLCGL